MRTCERGLYLVLALVASFLGFRPSVPWTLEVSAACAHIW